MGINHSSHLVGCEFFDGGETAQAASSLEKIEARATCLQIQLPADLQHAIADGFGFQPATGEMPEQPVARIHCCSVCDVSIGPLRFIRLRR